MDDTKVASSFRDPNGFLFFRDGTIYRQVNLAYKEHWDHLMNSGLYSTLVNAELLIPHTEVDILAEENDIAYKIIGPEIISFISYPYEWCFSQLKQAALTTLRIQKIAFSFGMSLRDCSAYNIQFRKGKAILIDTLSFEKYHEGQPWIAYRQFCQHFLAPLVLMAFLDIRLSQLLRIYIDGIPLDLASSLLPFRTHFAFWLLCHIHLHAKSHFFFADKTINTYVHKIKPHSFIALIDSLESAIRSLRLQPKGREWSDYYTDNSYSAEAFSHKKQIVSDFLDRIKLKNAWDLGANIGLFSRIASNKGIQTISFDSDPFCVEKSYLEVVKNGEINILPLLLDLTNPSPGIGWENQERLSLVERGPVDVILALALIHHLAISNNTPLNKIADFLAEICNFLLIEFVPKNDPQVQKMLLAREDIFTDYNQQAFENEFGWRFTILDSIKINNSERILYLMRNKRKS